MVAATPASPFFTWIPKEATQASQLQMSNNTFILCPGQGAQVVGMGKDFFESSSYAKETFDIANGVLGF